MPIRIVDEIKETLRLRNSYYSKENYKGVAAPSPCDNAREQIARVYDDMFRLGRFSDTDKILTVLYDMWRSGIGQENHMECTKPNQEGMYEALTKFFRTFDINTIRKMALEAKKLDRRPIPGYATDQGQW